MSERYLCPNTGREIEPDEGYCPDCGDEALVDERLVTLHPDDHARVDDGSTHVHSGRRGDARPVLRGLRGGKA